MRLRDLLLTMGAGLLVLSSSSCGGGPPDDASVNDFCTAIAPLNREGDQAAYDEVKEVGTPSDMPDDARRGFELVMDRADDGEDAGMTNPALADELSGDDASDYEALGEYIFDACVDGSPPGEQGSSLDDDS
jgi:hypothetical protein